VRIYLSGAMRHLPGLNHAAFDKAAARLRAAGHTVFSPAENDREKGYSAEIEAAGGTIPRELAARIILDDLAWICGEADAIAFLPGWDGKSIPPVVEDNPQGLPGLKCTWTSEGHYQCTWAGSGGAKLENMLVDWLGGFTKIDIPREWVV